MCKSELEYWDSSYVGPALLFMNQYLDFLVPEYYVLWVAFVSTTAKPLICAYIDTIFTPERMQEFCVTQHRL